MSSVSNPKREVPREIAKHLRQWAWLAAFLRLLQIFLGIAGTLCALAVTTFTDELSKGSLPWIKILSFTAAVSIGVLGAFDIGGHSNSVYRAWRYLTAEILRFEADPSYPIETLIKAYSDGEAMVGDVHFRRLEGKAEPKG